MNQWEYLRLGVGWSTDEKVGVSKISANRKTVFDYDTENQDKKKGEEKNLFNLIEYIDNLGKEGWELVNVFTWGNGWGEVYYFKRSLKN